MGIRSSSAVKLRLVGKTGSGTAPVAQAPPTRLSLTELSVKQLVSEPHAAVVDKLFRWDERSALLENLKRIPVERMEKTLRRWVRNQGGGFDGHLRNQQGQILNDKVDGSYAVEAHAYRVPGDGSYIRLILQYPSAHDFPNSVIIDYFWDQERVSLPPVDVANQGNQNLSFGFLEKLLTSNGNVRLVE